MLTTYLPVYVSIFNSSIANANALDGWSPDNWATTSATVDQAAGQYRLVAIGSGTTAKVQREFTALPNQDPQLVRETLVRRSQSFVWQVGTVDFRGRSAGLDFFATFCVKTKGEIIIFN